MYQYNSIKSLANKNKHTRKSIIQFMGGLASISQVAENLAKSYRSVRKQRVEHEIPGEID
ncbi:hypothetical protein ES706_02164 [subsurface metagenome]